MFKIKAKIYHASRGILIVHFYTRSPYFAWYKLCKDFNHVYYMNVYGNGSYNSYTQKKQPINKQIK